MYLSIKIKTFWLPFPSPGDLPNPGIEPGSPTLQEDASLSEPPGTHVAPTRFMEIGRASHALAKTARLWPAVSQLTNCSNRLILIRKL